MFYTVFAILLSPSIILLRVTSYLPLFTELLLFVCNTCTVFLYSFFHFILWHLFISVSPLPLPYFLLNLSSYHLTISPCHVNMLQSLWQVMRQFIYDYRPDVIILNSRYFTPKVHTHTKSSHSHTHAHIYVSSESTHSHTLRAHTHTHRQRADSQKETRARTSYFISWHLTFHHIV